MNLNCMSLFERNLAYLHRYLTEVLPLMNAAENAIVPDLKGVVFWRSCGLRQSAIVRRAGK